MRIAVVTDSYHPTRDGVVACIDVMKDALEKMGHKIFIVAPDPGAEDRIEGVHYFPSVKFKNYAGYFVPIYPSDKLEVIRNLNVDVVHIQGIAVMALKGMIAAHQLGIPIVVTFHTMVSDTMKYYSPIKMPDGVGEKFVWVYLKYLMRWADAIVAPTESTARELRENGLPIREMRIIPTSVDTKRFSPNIDGSRIRERYSLDGKKVIICVGRVSYEKDIDDLIWALQRVDSDVVLMVVGKGPAREDLEKLTNELGLQNRVIFTGFVPDEELVEHYAAADIAASASKFETQCLSILEAMSCGLPVVCADARAFRDYIVDGENGFLFGDTAEECASAMMKAMDADERLIRNAEATVAEFSVDNFVSKMVSLYEYVVENKRERK